MPSKINNITILGDGGWGTTLAVLLAKKGYPVKLWGPFPKYIQKIRKNRYNPKFLPGVKIPDNVELSENLSSSLKDADVIVFAIPSKYAVKILKRIAKSKTVLSEKVILSVTKGIDTTSLLRMSQTFKKELGKIHFAVLSGPTIAIEVATGVPSTAVIASENIKIAKKLQPIFSSETFRIYTNSDVVGVEIGGSIKNIIAISCGVCDGLGLGTNTKAAILTRGLAEMSRLGKAMGGKQKTFSGLSGLGDLVTTCFSPKSRNRFVGEQIGKGKKISDILSKMDMVAEGVETVKAVYQLSEKLKIQMPITTEVYNIIYKRKSPPKAVSSLMTRKMKSE